MKITEQDLEILQRYNMKCITEYTEDDWEYVRWDDLIKLIK
jgi:hypothetical protein